MQKGKDGDLAEIAAQVADRVAVDWPTETDETSRRVLANLRTLDVIGSVYATQPQSGDLSTLIDAPKSTERTEPLKTWGHLVIHGFIQRGGFGQVFRAYDPDLKKYVALKFPRAEKAGDTFIREAQKLAKVRHENVLTVHGVARHNGTVGIWTDLVEGSTLEERLEQQGIFGAHEAAQIGMEICRALAAVHKAGLVHSDVKTSNVIREVGGKHVLMDFGAATVAPSEGQQGDPLSGTPLYMAPEVLRGKRPTIASDLYALGVVLFRLVSLRYPVEGRSMNEIAESHRIERSTRLLDVRPDLPAGFVRVVEKALAADPTQRYRTAGEMEHALFRYLSPDVSPEPEAIYPSRRERALLIGGTALVLAVAGWNAYDFLAPFNVEAFLFRAGAETEERLVSGSHIAPGDQLFVEAKGSRSMHLYVLNQDQTGQAFLLFPLDGLDTQNPLRGDRMYRLPGTLRGTPNYWDVTSPGGEEMLLVIAARKPVPDIEAIRKRGVDGPVEISRDDVIRLRGRGITKVSPQPQPTRGLELEKVIKGLETRSSKEGGLWVYEFRLPNPTP